MSPAPDLDQKLHATADDLHPETKMGYARPLSNLLVCINIRFWRIHDILPLAVPTQATDDSDMSKW